MKLYTIDKEKKGLRKIITPLSRGSLCRMYLDNERVLSPNSKIQITIILGILLIRWLIKWLLNLIRKRLFEEKLKIGSKSWDLRHLRFGKLPNNRNLRSNMYLTHLQNHYLPLWWFLNIFVNIQSLQSTPRRTLWIPHHMRWMMSILLHRHLHLFLIS